MKDLMAAIGKLLDELEKDENGGGLLSRQSLRAASELRLEVHRAQRLPGEEQWRALVVDWSIRVEGLEEMLAQVAHGPISVATIEQMDAAMEAPNPPLVPGQPVMEAQSDGDAPLAGGREMSDLVLFSDSGIAQQVETLEARIAALEAENARLEAVIKERGMTVEEAYYAGIKEGEARAALTRESGN